MKGKNKDMKRKLTTLVHVLDHISAWSGKIVGPLVLVMIFIVMYEVISRYFFNSPTTWALQLSTMVFGSYMILGGAYSLYAGNYVNMDLFYAHWSDRTKALVDVITFPLIMYFLYLMLWKTMVYGIESIRILEHSSGAWGQPLYHWKMTAVLGVLILILQNINEFVRNIILLATGEKIR